MAYNYTPNNWVKYNDSTPLNEQLETIITKTKLDHMEAGIKSANIERRIGNVVQDATRITPTAQYRIDTVNGIEYLDITIPGTSSAERDGGVADKVSHLLKFTGATIAEFDGSIDTVINLVGSSSGNGEIFNDYTNNKATGSYAHAEGTGTLASSTAQHVEGKFNVEDKAGKYLHILGGGTSNTNRKNIHTVDTIGNAYYAGNVEIGGSPTSSNHLVNKQYVDTNVNSINNQLNNMNTQISNINNKISDLNAGISNCSCELCTDTELMNVLKQIWP